MYVVAADTAGPGGSVVVEQLSPFGVVVGALSQTIGVLPFGWFQTVDDTVTVGSGVSAVRVRLAGGLLGTTTFDDVRFWQQ
jgi:hypothetical protein